MLKDPVPRPPLCTGRVEPTARPQRPPRGLVSPICTGRSEPMTTMMKTPVTSPPLCTGRVEPAARPRRSPRARGGVAAGPRQMPYSPPGSTKTPCGIAWSDGRTDHPDGRSSSFEGSETQRSPLCTGRVEPAARPWRNPRARGWAAAGPRQMRHSLRGSTKRPCGIAWPEGLTGHPGGRALSCEGLPPTTVAEGVVMQWPCTQAAVRGA